MRKLLFVLLLFPGLAVGVPYTITFDLVGDTGPLMGLHAIGTVVVDAELATDVLDEGGPLIEFRGPLATDMQVDFAGIAYDESHIIDDVRLSLHRTTGLPVELVVFGGRDDLPSGGDEWFVALSGSGENLAIYLPGDDLVSSFTGMQSGLIAVPEPATWSLFGLVFGVLSLLRWGRCRSTCTP